MIKHALDFVKLCLAYHNLEKVRHFLDERARLLTDRQKLLAAFKDALDIQEKGLNDKEALIKKIRANRALAEKN